MLLSKNKQYILFGIVISILLHINTLLLFTIKKQYQHQEITNKSAFLNNQTFFKQPPTPIQKKQTASKKIAPKEINPKQIVNVKKPIMKTFFMELQEKTGKGELIVGHKLMPKNNAPAVVQKAPDNSTDNVTALLKPISSEVNLQPTPDKKQSISVQPQGKSESDPTLSITQHIQLQSQEKSKNELKKEIIQQEQKKEIENKASKSTTLSGEKSMIQNNNVEKKHLFNAKSTGILSIKKTQEAESYEPVIDKKTTESEANNLHQTNPQASTTTSLSTNSTKEALFSLKDLQKGFTKFLRHGNNDVIERSGDKNIEATPGDLKLMSYYRQVMNTIESALNYVGRIHEIEKGTSDKEVPFKEVSFLLIIERDGSISNYYITQKSNHEMLNNHVIKIIENLGSLPPLPHFIKAPHFFNSGIIYFHNKINYN